MPKEKHNSPDAWTPGVFGIFNEKGLREDSQRRWEDEARTQNKARPLGEKLLGRARTSAELVMLGEAHEVDEQVDQARREGKVPQALRHEKLGQGILEESGIETPKRFSSAKGLEDVLKQSDIHYDERVHSASQKIDAEAHEQKAA